MNNFPLLIWNIERKQFYICKEVKDIPLSESFKVIQTSANSDHLTIARVAFQLGKENSK